MKHFIEVQHGSKVITKIHMFIHQAYLCKYEALVIPIDAKLMLEYVNWNLHYQTCSTLCKMYRNKNSSLGYLVYQVVSKWTILTI